MSAIDTKLKPGDVELVEPEPAQLARTAVERHANRLAAIEDELFEESAIVVRDALKFRDVDPNSDEIPAEWRDMDPDEARKRMRMARANWMNAKEAPVGLKMAQAVMNGIAKARAQQGQAKGDLNVVVQVVTTPRQYPRKRLGQ